MPKEINLLFPYKVKYAMMMLAEAKNYGHIIHNVAEAWKQTKGEGVKVGIIDTGMPIHRDVESQVVEYKDFTGSEDVYDHQGHSTHVSGIIAAIENDEGVVGIAPKSKLYIAKGLNDSGTGTDESLANSIYWMMEKKVDIINMSLGTPSSYSEFFPKTEKAIKDAYKKNIAVICACGNENADKVGFPANMKETIAVAAVNSKKERANFSNRGPKLDFAAAGVDILSTYKNNLYAELSGSSMACPQITGIAALLISSHIGKAGNTPINNVEDLRQHILKMSIDLGNSGHDIDFGDGLPVFGHLIEDVSPSKNIKKIERKWLDFKFIQNFLKRFF